MEKDSAVPSIDSNSTVDHHTEVLHQTGSSHQSVLGAPAPGISVGSATQSPEKFTSDPSLDDDGGGPLNRSMSRDPPPPNLCLDYLGKCGDYLNPQQTLKLIINLILNTNDCIKKIYLDEYYNNIFNIGLNKLNIDLDDSKQFAFILFIKKNDDTLDLKYLKEYKPNSKQNIHSEDDIFYLLKEILDKNDCPYKEALIFSFNSLCQARSKFTSCSAQAIDIAWKLYEKHRMKMVIGFYKAWGINGSYEKCLPYKPLKDCTYTFMSQKVILGSNNIIISNVTTKKKKKEVDKNLLLLEPIYKKYTADIQNKAFSMEDKDTDTREYDLDQFWSKINNKNPQNKEKFHQIVSHLFELPASNKTFDDSKNYALEKFYKCMKEIYNLLIGDDANSFNILFDDLVNSPNLLIGDDANLSDCSVDNLYKEIHSDLQNIFFHWWAKKLEDASSRFLNKEISCFLQESAVYFFLRDIQKKYDFFVIGYCY